jgi:hypothetical protein
MTVQQWLPFMTQTKTQLLIDIIVITLVIHASGGLKTSFRLILSWKNSVDRALNMARTELYYEFI